MIAKQQRKQIRGINPTKNKVDSTVTWNYKGQYLLESDAGNFIWNDPFAGGDGVIRPYNGTYNDWIAFHKIPHARYKGEHMVDEFCVGAKYSPTPIVL